MNTVLKKLTGFTLLEMIVVITIIGILVAAVTPIAVSWVGAYNATLDTAVALDRLRYSTERIARELRDVKSIGGSYQFGTMGTATATFTQNSTGRTVAVAQDGNTVTLSYSDVSSVIPVLTNQVSSLGFRYLKQDGITETADQTLVRYVEISLTVTQGTQSYSERTRITLRNL